MRRLLSMLGVAGIIGLLPLVSLTAQASGARLTVSNRKVLVETDHFGSYYLPEVLASGRNVFAFWRGPDQSGTQRTVAISKDGGRSFKKQKKIRPPALSQIFASAIDADGNFYFAGPTVFANELAIVRADKKLKSFTQGAIISTEKNVVYAQLHVARDGRLLLAYQTSFLVRLRGGITTTAEQSFFSSSVDRGSTFAEFTEVNEKPAEFSDAAPRFIEGASGELFLLYLHASTPERAAAGDAYAATSVEAKTISAAEPTVISFPRSVTSDGNPTNVQGYVAADGSLCVAWSERVTGSANRADRVYFASALPGLPPEAPNGPLATVGNSYLFHLVRTPSGLVVVLLHGAGFDSNADEPAVIGLASSDDGRTFGTVEQITEYPPVTSVRAGTDGTNVFGIWTDTRQVVLATFNASEGT